MSIPEDREEATSYYLGILNEIKADKFKPIIEAVVDAITGGYSRESSNEKYSNYSDNFNSLLKDIEENTGRIGIQTKVSKFYEYINEYIDGSYIDDEAQEADNEYISDCLKTALTKYME